MTTAVAEDFPPPLLLTEGGPGDAVMRRLGLAQHAGRAAVVLALVTWLPLLVLSLVEGRAVGGAAIPFLHDIAAQVRFLVAVPILLFAEIPIGRRLRQVATHFVTAGLVRPEDRPRFIEIVNATLDLRDSRRAEILVLAAAYVSTYSVITGASLRADNTWWSAGSHEGLTHVGLWYALV